MATKKLQLYKCQVCSNLVEVVLEGYGDLHCCGQPMQLLEAQTSEDNELQEKHIPILFETQDGKKEVRVAAKWHPMLEEHYIMFLEVISEDTNKLMRKYFYPNEMPVLELECDCKNKSARAFCNVHGLWEGKLD